MVPPLLDLTGERFGRLTVTNLWRRKLVSEKKQWSAIQWFCRCDCGKTKWLWERHLKNGATKSCRCLQSQAAKKIGLGIQIRPSTKHGKTGTKVYRAWTHMRDRCYNLKDSRYADYGGRGITVYPQWRDDFLAFYTFIGEPPSPKHSIDRIDNDGNYEPGNVHWASPKEQAENRRSRYR